MRRSDIPPELVPAFSVSDARRAGASRSRLRSRDLDSRFYGARSVIDAQLVPDAAVDAQRAYPRSAAARRVHEDAARYAPVMTDGSFFSHTTGAVLWDVPLPAAAWTRADGAGGASEAENLHVSVFWPRRAPRGARITGHALRAHLAHTMRHPVSGLPLTSPATTWMMLAGVLRHPYDLVAAADYFLHIARAPHDQSPSHAPEPMATVDHFVAALAAGRRPGRARLRTALDRARTGSASRPETWTRLSLVDAGLPEPELDHDVFDRDHRFIARVDMAYPRWKIAVEYEGRHHREEGQQEHDIERYARLEADGWRIIRVTRTLLFRDPQLLAVRVGRALADRRR